MFRCQRCKEVSKPREPQFKVTTRWRDVVYKSGSHGSEIAEEIEVCESCYKQLTTEPSKLKTVC
jgi:hypothetical protein